MSAALITSAIDATTDLRAFFWSGQSFEIPPRDNRSKVILPSRQTRPQSSVGPELVPARMGEEYTYCGRACCHGDHRVKQPTRGAYAAASLGSCGEKGGGWEGAYLRVSGLCGTIGAGGLMVRHGHASLLLRGWRWWFMIYETL